MFDFARFGEAVGRGLGWPAGSFLSAYNDNRLDATVATLEDSPVGTALLWLAHRMPKPWSGTTTKLHGRLTQLVGKKIAVSARWPKTSSALGNELRRIAPQLRMHGLSINFERTRESRSITLTAIRAPIVPSPSHVTSSPIKSSAETPMGRPRCSVTRKSNACKGVAPRWRLRRRAASRASLNSFFSGDRRLVRDSGGPRRRRSETGAGRPPPRGTIARALGKNLGSPMLEVARSSRQSENRGRRGLT
jgi:hypothetical protein